MRSSSSLPTLTLTLATERELTVAESGPPYRQAIKTDSLVFLSGCIPLVPETMKVIEGGVEEQTVRLPLSLGSAQGGSGAVG